MAALTTYDYPMTRMLDEAGVPFLLVGARWEWWCWGIPIRRT